MDSLFDIELKASKFDDYKNFSENQLEIEFALVLARMINTVRDDPEQMRLAIYELARSKLLDSIPWADEVEKERLSDALSVAIKGVENHSQRHDDKPPRLQPAPAQPRLTPSPSLSPVSVSPAPAAPISTPPPSYRKPAVSAAPPKPPEIPNPSRIFTAPPAVEREEKKAKSTPERQRAGLLMPLRLAIVILLVGAAGSVAFYKQRSFKTKSDQTAAATTIAPPPTPFTPPAQRQQQSAFAASAPAKTAVPAQQGSFPVPGVFGVYVLNNGALSELELLTERVPDKRIAVSAPITSPSRTMLSDGRLRFVVFRPEVASNPPERVDIRVVAEVNRDVTFDDKGKVNFAPVKGAWNIRNVGPEFRARPFPGNPQMLIVQPENNDFTLPPGRYMLVVGGQGYDFTVSGQVTDPLHCLERTNAANGTFYSECQKPEAPKPEVQKPAAIETNRKKSK